MQVAHITGHAFRDYRELDFEQWMDVGGTDERESIRTI
jgi:hypothetical protein